MFPKRYLILNWEAIGSITDIVGAVGVIGEDERMGSLSIIRSYVANKEFRKWLVEGL